MKWKFKKRNRKNLPHFVPGVGGGISEPFEDGKVEQEHHHDGNHASCQKWMKYLVEYPALKVIL